MYTIVSRVVWHDVDSACLVELGPLVLIRLVVSILLARPTIDRYKYLFVVSDKMKKSGKMERVIDVGLHRSTLFDSQPYGPVYVDW